MSRRGYLHAAGAATAGNATATVRRALPVFHVNPYRVR